MEHGEERTRWGLSVQRTQGGEVRHPSSLCWTLRPRYFVPEVTGPGDPRSPMHTWRQARGGARGLTAAVRRHHPDMLPPWRQAKPGPQGRVCSCSELHYSQSKRGHSPDAHPTGGTKRMRYPAQQSAVKGTSIGQQAAGGRQRRQVGMRTNHKQTQGALWGNGDVLQLDCGDSCTA